MGMYYTVYGQIFQNSGNFVWKLSFIDIIFREPDLSFNCILMQNEQEKTCSMLYEFSLYCSF